MQPANRGLSSLPVQELASYNTTLYVELKPKSQLNKEQYRVIQEVFSKMAAEEQKECFTSTNTNYFSALLTRVWRIILYYISPKSFFEKARVGIVDKVHAEFVKKTSKVPYPAFLGDPLPDEYAPLRKAVLEAWGGRTTPLTTESSEKVIKDAIVEFMRTQVGDKTFASPSHESAKETLELAKTAIKTATESQQATAKAQAEAVQQRQEAQARLAAVEQQQKAEAQRKRKEDLGRAQGELVTATEARTSLLERAKQLGSDLLAVTQAEKQAQEHLKAPQKEKTFLLSRLLATLIASYKEASLHTSGAFFASTDSYFIIAFPENNVTTDMDTLESSIEDIKKKIGLLDPKNFGKFKQRVDGHVRKVEITLKKASTSITELEKQIETEGLKRKQILKDQSVCAGQINENEQTIRALNATIASLKQKEMEAQAADAAAIAAEIASSPPVASPSGPAAPLPSQAPPVPEPSQLIQQSPPLQSVESLQSIQPTKLFDTSDAYVETIIKKMSNYYKKFFENGKTLSAISLFLKKSELETDGKALEKIHTFNYLLALWKDKDLFRSFRKIQGIIGVGGVFTGKHEERVVMFFHGDTSKGDPSDRYYKEEEFTQFSCIIEKDLERFPPGHQIFKLKEKAFELRHTVLKAATREQQERASKALLNVMIEFTETFHKGPQRNGPGE